MPKTTAATTPATTRIARIGKKSTIPKTTAAILAGVDVGEYFARTCSN